MPLHQGAKPRKLLALASRLVVPVRPSVGARQVVAHFRAVRRQAPRRFKLLNSFGSFSQFQGGPTQQVMGWKGVGRQAHCGLGVEKCVLKLFRSQLNEGQIHVRQGAARRNFHLLPELLFRFVESRKGNQRVPVSVVEKWGIRKVLKELAIRCQRLVQIV